MKIEAKEIYELAKHLHDASLIMKKIHDPHAQILIQMSSDVLDLLDDTRFSNEESKEIEDIVEELSDE